MIRHHTTTLRSDLRDRRDIRTNTVSAVVKTIGRRITQRRRQPLTSTNRSPARPASGARRVQLRRIAARRSDYGRAVTRGSARPQQRRIHQPPVKGHRWASRRGQSGCQRQQWSTPTPENPANANERPRSPRPPGPPALRSRSARTAALLHDVSGGWQFVIAIAFGASPISLVRVRHPEAATA